MQQLFSGSVHDLPVVRNVHGQKFELLASVPEISLLELPRGVAPNASLRHVLASITQLERSASSALRGGSDETRAQFEAPALGVQSSMA
eukprot:9944452-Prorocentrum_lima.AAC.1